MRNLFNLNLRSRILNAIGSFVFGSPEKLGVPADFYWLATDRSLPAPGEDDVRHQRIRVATNRIRLALSRRARLVGAAINVLVFVVALPLVLMSYAAPKSLGLLGQYGKVASDAISDRLMTDEERKTVQSAEALVRKNIAKGIDVCSAMPAYLAGEKGQAKTPEWREELRKAANSIAGCEISEEEAK